MAGQANDQLGMPQREGIGSRTRSASRAASRTRSESGIEAGAQEIVERDLAAAAALAQQQAAAEFRAEEAALETAARDAAEALERARARRAEVEPEALRPTATAARPLLRNAQDALAEARQAEERLARRRAALERVARAQQELAELTLAELPEGEADPDAQVRGGLQDLFAGRQVDRLNSFRLGGSRPQSRGVEGALATKGGPCSRPEGHGGRGPEGYPGMPPAPGPNPGGYVKVQQAPRFKGQTYSAYITWEVQFEYWARMRRLWDIYLGLVEPPVLTGYTPELLGQHAVAMQEYVANREWAYGELVQALQLDEHVQLVLEFKGDTETPPSPHEAWMMIRSLFMRELPTSKIQLTKQLGQLKLREGESIMAFWNRATNLRARYCAVHGKIEPEEWMGRILSALPDSWENIISIQSQLLPILTEKKLLSILTEEEDRRKAKRGGKGGEPSGALAAQAGNPKGKGGQAGGKGKRSGSPAKKVLGRDGKWGELGPAPRNHCHGCHLPDHMWFECPDRPSESARPAHWQARGKPKSEDRGRGKTRWQRGDAAVGESEGDSDDEEAEVYVAEAKAASVLPAGARRPREDDTWIVDSGASYIFTPYEADFDGPLSDPISDEVRVGNGTVLPILGQGTVKVQGPEGRVLTLTGVHLVPAMHSRLLSVNHFTDKGAKAVFEGTTCEVYKGGGSCSLDAGLARGQWASKDQPASGTPTNCRGLRGGSCVHGPGAQAPGACSTQHHSEDGEEGDSSGAEGG